MTKAQSTKRQTHDLFPLPDCGPELKVDKDCRTFYPDWELEDQIVEQIKNIVSEKLESAGISGEDRARIISKAFTDLSRPAEAPSELPAEAPALYMQRADKSQSAEAFTHEHYSKYFGKGLTRADLKKLDLSLYRMLMKGTFPASLADKIPPAQGKGGGGRKPKLSDAERSARARARSRETSKRHRMRHGG